VTADKERKENDEKESQTIDEARFNTIFKGDLVEHAQHIGTWLVVLKPLKLFLLTNEPRVPLLCFIKFVMSPIRIRIDTS
jgi:hypothetical protein